MKRAINKIFTAQQQQKQQLEDALNAQNKKRQTGSK